MKIRPGQMASSSETLTVGSIIPPDQSQNLGSSSFRYANVYATLFNGVATSARYADLAERYHADAAYEPGTVVVIGGDNEITESTIPNDPRALGVISTAPALMMNSDAGDDASHPYVALRGRVPCRVVGPVRKGDLLTTSVVPGCAMHASDPVMGSIIGRALEDSGGGRAVIEIAV